MTGWWTVAFVVQWILLVVLAVVVIALARQVGTLHLRLGPRGALEIDDEGPMLGDTPMPAPARDAAGRTVMLGGPGPSRVVLFSSPTCGVCREVAPALGPAAASVHYASVVLHDPDAERAWNVPGTPFAVVLDPHGIVVAKGTVNNLEQIEGLIDAAIADPGGRVTGIVEVAGRALASRTSRRGFLGSVGRGVVALAGGGFVASALAPDRAEAHHICGHTYTTGSCPHPYSPLSRVDRYGYPLHPTYGYPVDDRGRRYVDPKTQIRRRMCQEVVPDVYPFVTGATIGGGWTRCCSGRLRHIVDCCSESSTRINGDYSVTGYCPSGLRVFCIGYRELNQTC